MTLKYLLEKEFKQFFRNSFLPRMVVIFPVMIMIVMPLVATMDIKGIDITVVDSDHSTLSRRLVDKIGASSYFRLQEVRGSYDEAIEDVEYGTADIVLEIPAKFETDLRRSGTANVQISANTVNGTKGSLGSSYLSTIIAGFSQEIAAAKGPDAAGGSMLPAGVAVPKIGIDVQSRYNPYLNYKIFMIPALMVILLIMLCGFLPALNIVGEKEKGTIEQINVTPVSKFTFILGKLIPYWVVGFTVLSIAFLLARVVYGLSPAGNLLTIYGFATLFILAMSGFGLVVSNYSATMQQAMFVMFFFVMIFQLMSGLFTPVKSMPEWAQWVAVFNPPKYFINVTRLVYLKGSGFADLLPELAALSGFVLFFNLWAVFSYRKNS